MVVTEQEGYRNGEWRGGTREAVRRTGEGAEAQRRQVGNQWDGQPSASSPVSPVTDHGGRLRPAQLCPPALYIRVAVSISGHPDPDMYMLAS